MSVANLTQTDRFTRDAVLQQLEWDPAVDASAIGVSAQSGIVTLTGFIGSYAGKLAAERAAKRVRGVRGVANDIDVRPMFARTDADIARDAVTALELRGTVPESVQAVVHNGHITLTGRVQWIYQKREAEKAVRNVKGSRGVFNHIDVAAGAVARDLRHRILSALHRAADLDARRINVMVNEDVAVLTGTVTTWLQRDVAEHAAADAPGVTRVDNQIAVEPAVEPVDEIC